MHFAEKFQEFKNFQNSIILIISKLKNFKNNLRQNIWMKIKKSRKIKQDQRTSSSSFANFFAVVTKVLVLETRLGIRPCLTQF